MDERAIKTKLETAAKALIDNQPDIFDFTSETGQTEWNLTHHLAKLDCTFSLLTAER
jgi:hypothetical protein